MLDLSTPVTLSALIQAATPLIAGLAFLFALRLQWRMLEQQRTFDRDESSKRMANLEIALSHAVDELKLMREALIVVANQGVRIEFLEKAINELKHGIGFIRPPEM